MSHIQEFNKANDTNTCICFAVSLLVWPQAIITFSVHTYRSLKGGYFFQALPLLVSQLSNPYIWTSITVLYAGRFNYRIDEVQLIKGPFFGFRHDLITTFLSSTLYLCPMSLFLYTWRFLLILAQETESKILRNFLKRLAYAMIFLIPVVYFGALTNYVID